MLKAKFISKVQQRIHSFEITTQNMFNIPKSTKDELQDFIELLGNPKVQRMSFKTS